LIRASLLVAAVVFAGCGGTSDPCDGVSGTCVALTITSSTVKHVDTLAITAFGESESSAAGKVRSLPIHVALVPPASASGTNVIAVTASASGAVVGNGSATATVTPGKRTAVTLVLESAAEAPDMSVPVPADLSEVSESDGGGADLSSTSSSCPIGQALCTSSSGVAICIDITSDPQNCGGCGKVCLLGQICHNAGCIENTVNCSSPGATCQLSSCSNGQLSVSAAGDVVVDVANGRRLWSRAAQAATTFGVANGFCGSLKLDGVDSGWRLPTFTEAGQTTLHAAGLMGCPTCDPAIDQAAFPGVAADATDWTTSPGPGGVYQLVDYCAARSTYYGDPTSDNESYHCTHDPL
jgi:hypothetical protein